MMTIPSSHSRGRLKGCDSSCELMTHPSIHSRGAVGGGVNLLLSTRLLRRNRDRENVHSHFETLDVNGESDKLGSRADTCRKRDRMRRCKHQVVKTKSTPPYAPRIM
ncbi:hypothetical protein PILCRDRAFT_818304 [Piloderma croceum F 1598]|uniref:Uncharacterized protein n=1 Tax=Piloderma croceum (strain F 1598) TaxID=765440 RepID=A0A0C3C4Z6_PILCF|nr:hypothetical protein PILCRDRAFT_818304 [Piloderma croceum F 1598]